MLEPRGALAVVAALRHREMGEQAIRRGAVPVPRVGWDDPGVAGIEDLRRLALQAKPADTAETIEHLADRMAVPGGARARREGHDRGAHARRRLGDDHLVLPDHPGEVCRRTLLGR